MHASSGSYAFLRPEGVVTYLDTRATYVDLSIWIAIKIMTIARRERHRGAQAMDACPCVISSHFCNTH